MPSATNKEGLQSVYNMINTRNNLKKPTILTILRSKRFKKLKKKKYGK